MALVFRPLYRRHHYLVLQPFYLFAYFFCENIGKRKHFSKKDPRRQRRIVQSLPVAQPNA